MWSICDTSSSILASPKWNMLFENMCACRCHIMIYSWTEINNNNLVAHDFNLCCEGVCSVFLAVLRAGHNYNDPPSLSE